MLVRLNAVFVVMALEQEDTADAGDSVIRIALNL